MVVIEIVIYTLYVQIDAEGKVPRKVSVTNMISKKGDFNGSNSDSPFLEIDEEEYHPIPKVPTLYVHKCGLEAFHCQTQCMRCCQQGG